MRGVVLRIVAISAFAALAAACSTAPERSTAGLPSGGVYKVGIPYEEGGVRYYPREEPDYDETGIASWYGPNFHGKRTANGEVFDAGGLTAAHPTLPMPVNVRVTNLENGRSLVLRVNDRGPFARGRIIDVSARAAEILGFYGKGTARVRVTYLSRASLPGELPFEAPPSDTPNSVATAVAAAPSAPIQMAALDPVSTAPAEIVAAPAPPVEASPPAASDAQAQAPDAASAISSDAQLYVQAGAFTALENAQRLKDRLAGAGDLTISSIDRNGELLYRVRIGPFEDLGAADAALALLAGLGSSDAKIVVDR